MPFINYPTRSGVAVIGYYWQRGTLADIGEDLGRSGPAVAGLVHLVCNDCGDNWWR